MKRYLVFAGDKYYPRGGINDFIGAFDGINEARAFAKTHTTDTGHYWYQIVEYMSFAVVEQDEGEN